MGCWVLERADVNWPVVAVSRETQSVLLWDSICKFLIKPSSGHPLGVANASVGCAASWLDIAFRGAFTGHRAQIVSLCHGREQRSFLQMGGGLSTNVLNILLASCCYWTQLYLEKTTWDRFDTWFFTNELPIDKIYGGNGFLTGGTEDMFIWSFSFTQSHLLHFLRARSLRGSAMWLPEDGNKGIIDGFSFGTAASSSLTRLDHVLVQLYFLRGLVAYERAR